MSAEGGPTESLDGPQVVAFARLLDAGARLAELGDLHDGRLSAFRDLGAAIEENSCMLAGITTKSLPEGAERLVVVIQLAPVFASDLWVAQADEPKSKAKVHWQSETKVAALVGGLVALARQLLDDHTKGDGTVTPEWVMSDALRECLYSYEDNLQSVREARAIMDEEE